MIAATELHPAYLEVARAIAAERPPPGRIYEHAWLFAALHVQHPETAKTWRAARTMELAYSRAILGLQRVLLEDHKIALRSVIGKGYEVVAPEEQIAWSRREVNADIRNAVRKAYARTTHLDPRALTPARAVEQANEQARLGSIVQATRRRTFAPSKPPKGLPPKGG